jgi:hypothetical protein
MLALLTVAVYSTDFIGPDLASEFLKLAPSLPDGDVEMFVDPLVSSASTLYIAIKLRTNKPLRTERDFEKTEA